MADAQDTRSLRECGGESSDGARKVKPTPIVDRKGPQSMTLVVPVYWSG